MTNRRRKVSIEILLKQASADSIDFAEGSAAAKEDTSSTVVREIGGDGQAGSGCVRGRRRGRGRGRAGSAVARALAPTCTRKREIRPAQRMDA